MSAGSRSCRSVPAGEGVAMPEIPLPDPPLSDGTVELRAFSLADVPHVTAALQDPEISRWTATIPWPYTEKNARDWIGYWVGRPWRKRGVATRATNLVSAWALGGLGLDCLYLFTIMGNAASERVAAKAGFEAVEVIPEHDLGSTRATVTLWKRSRA